MALVEPPDRCFVGNGCTVGITDHKTEYAGHVRDNSPVFFEFI
jgi:hypothetical protein